MVAVAVREGHRDGHAPRKLAGKPHDVPKARHGVHQKGAIATGHHIGAVLEGVGQLPDALGDAACEDEVGHGRSGPS